MMTGDTWISPTPAEEMITGFNLGLKGQQIQSREVFLWYAAQPKRAELRRFRPSRALERPRKQQTSINGGLRLSEDYFSCPQLSRKDLASAVQSIPGYVARCDYLFVLCPALKAESGETLNMRSWAHRGWCLAESMAAELSQTKALLDLFHMFLARWRFLKLVQGLLDSS